MISRENEKPDGAGSPPPSVARGTSNHQLPGSSGCPSDFRVGCRKKRVGLIIVDDTQGWSRGVVDRAWPWIGWEAGRIVDILSLIHISEPTRLGMISYAVFCLKK